MPRTEPIIDIRPDQRAVIIQSNGSQRGRSAVNDSSCRLRLADYDERWGQSKAATPGDKIKVDGFREKCAEFPEVSADFSFDFFVTFAFINGF